jgi:hypothetical protein
VLCCCCCCCRSVANNAKLSGFLPSSFKDREFNLQFASNYDIQTTKFTVESYNYGAGGRTLYTSYGGIWRCTITNWQGLPDNKALATVDNGGVQPNPDPCVANPLDYICQI